MISGYRRWTWIVWALVLLGAACIVFYLMRRPMLRAAGRLLVVNEPVDSADVIVLPVDADGGGVLEAADLVHSGLSARVAIFEELPDTIVDREFMRRGGKHETAAERSTPELNALGVSNVEQIPTHGSGTEDEGPALAEWCEHHRYRSVVVVSSPDHSRRLRRVLHRATKDHQTKITVHSTRYSLFDPDRWWETHDGIRIEIEESEKLLLDFLRHPVP